MEDRGSFAGGLGVWDGDAVKAARYHVAGIFRGLGQGADFDLARGAVIGHIIILQGQKEASILQYKRRAVGDWQKGQLFIDLNVKGPVLAQIDHHWKFIGRLEQIRGINVVQVRAEHQEIGTGELVLIPVFGADCIETGSRIVQVPDQKITTGRLVIVFQRILNDCVHTRTFYGSCRRICLHQQMDRRRYKSTNKVWFQTCQKRI